MLKDVEKRTLKPLDEAEINNDRSVSLQQSTPDEMMVDFITSASCNPGDFKKLLEFYDGLTPTNRKTKAKKYSRWIWDFWVLNNAGELSYEELTKRVLNNKWFYPEYKAIQDREFDKALPYFYSLMKFTGGVVAKKIDPGIICDCIIIVLNSLSRLFEQYNVDFADLILGDYVTDDWIPFDMEDEATNRCESNIILNVNDVEIYFYAGKNRRGMIKHHRTDLVAVRFTMYVLRCIDNHFRALIDYANYLKNDFDVTDIAKVGFDDAFNKIDNIVASVVEYCYKIGIPVFDGLESVNRDRVIISHNSERLYEFKGTANTEDILSVDEIVKSEVERYYFQTDSSDIIEKMSMVLSDSYDDDSLGANSGKLYESFEIDIDNVDINEWKIQSVTRPLLKQTFVGISLGGFHRKHDDYYEKFMDIPSESVEYDPEYDFTLTSVMKKTDGLFGKDVSTLTALSRNSKDFSQWIKWIENGRIVFPRNEFYVQILFYYLLNERILRGNHSAILVIMTRFWNHFFGDNEDMSKEASIYYEWIKEFWMLNCKDCTYEAFKSLFCTDIEFDLEPSGGTPIDRDVYDECLNGHELTRFYNENCDYKAAQSFISMFSGYINYETLLESALEQVGKGLEDLWKEYGLDFWDYLLSPGRMKVTQKRELYCRAIISHRTRFKVLKEFSGIEVSNFEKYRIERNSENGWPMLVFDVMVSSDIPRKRLLEYFIKTTEMTIREMLDENYHFTIDRDRLYEYYPNKLFLDNITTLVVERRIIKAALEACLNSGLDRTRFRLNILNDTSSMSIEDMIDLILKKAKERAENDPYAKQKEYVKKLKERNKPEYDIIDRDQTVDSESLAEAREVLIKNQNRLIIEETDVDSIVNANEARITDEFLTEDEKSVLITLAEGADIREISLSLEQKGVSMSNLVESINEKAVDRIGDIVIDDETFELIEDYRNEIEEMITN